MEIRGRRYRLRVGPERMPKSSIPYTAGAPTSTMIGSGGASGAIVLAALMVPAVQSTCPGASAAISRILREEGRVARPFASPSAGTCRSEATTAHSCMRLFYESRGVPHWDVAARGSLFEVDVPNGFQYRPDFITTDEEASLAEE